MSEGKRDWRADWHPLKWCIKGENKKITSPRLRRSRIYFIAGAWSKLCVRDNIRFVNWFKKKIMMFLKWFVMLKFGFSLLSDSIYVDTKLTLMKKLKTLITLDRVLLYVFCGHFWRSQFLIFWSWNKFVLNLVSCWSLLHIRVSTDC